MYMTMNKYTFNEYVYTYNEYVYIYRQWIRIEEGFVSDHVYVYDFIEEGCMYDNEYVIYVCVHVYIYIYIHIYL